MVSSSLCPSEPWSYLGGPQNQLGGPQNQLGGPQNQLGGPYTTSQFEDDSKGFLTVASKNRIEKKKST